MGQDSSMELGLDEFGGVPNQPPQLKEKPKDTWSLQDTFEAMFRCPCMRLMANCNWPNCPETWNAGISIP